MLCTNEGLVNSVEILPGLGKSDHLCINMSLNTFNHVTLEKDRSDKFKCYNWSKITDNEILDLSRSIDWNYSSEHLNTDQMWDEIHGKLMKLTGNVPLKNVDCSDKNSNMPWITSALKHSRKVKEKMWACFDREPTPINLNVALAKQKVFEDKELSAKLNFERKITASLKSSSKPFYSYLRNRRKVKTIVTSLKKEDGSLTKNDKETADIFCDAFSSVFVNEPFGPLPEECYDTTYGIPICDIVIEDSNVKEELCKLDIYKSFGPDTVHPKLLKSLCNNTNFVHSVGELFRKCADTGMIPPDWKLASIVALHKSGSRDEALNYRPVSLTSILCKVYEKIVRKHILNYVSNLISKSQHGFVNKRSCLSNLLETVDAILDILETGDPVDILYLDFCKAFDTVPHYRLLTKMESMGITGRTLKIIQDFLSGRSMTTVVRGSHSMPKTVLSGVPQGSVLGPLLFVLYINDLPNSIKHNICKLFADDLKIIANANKYSELCHDLSKLEEWESLWLLRFNTEKCKVMSIECNNNPKNVYSLDNSILSSVDIEKDLGVITSNNLGWEDHIMKTMKTKFNTFTI